MSPTPEPTLEIQLAEQSALVRLLMDENPDGISILTPEGTLRTNPAGARIIGILPADLPADEWNERWGYFAGDGVTRRQLPDLPIMRAANRGETIRDELLHIRGPNLPDGVTLAVSASPLPSGGAIAVFRDVTQRLALERDLAARNEELARTAAENRALVDRLRIALDELSTPVLEVDEDVLVLPVIGVVDTQRSAQMCERLLAEVVRARARWAIIDLTGVEILDTSTADRFARLARAVELLGAHCLLCGLQPSVAQTLVDIGVELGGLATQRNLRHALETCRRPAAGKTRRNDSRKEERA